MSPNSECRLHILECAVQQHDQKNVPIDVLHASVELTRPRLHSVILLSFHNIRFFWRVREKQRAALRPLTWSISLSFTFLLLFAPLTAFTTTRGLPACTIPTEASRDLTSVMSEIVATSSLADTLGRTFCKGEPTTC